MLGQHREDGSLLKFIFVAVAGLASDPGLERLELRRGVSVLIQVEKANPAVVAVDEDFVGSHIAKESDKLFIILGLRGLAQGGEAAARSLVLALQVFPALLHRGHRPNFGPGAAVGEKVHLLLVAEHGRIKSGVGGDELEGSLQVVEAGRRGRGGQQSTTEQRRQQDGQNAGRGERAGSITNLLCESDREMRMG